MTLIKTENFHASLLKLPYYLFCVLDMALQRNESVVAYIRI